MTRAFPPSLTKVRIASVASGGDLLLAEQQHVLHLVLVLRERRLRPREARLSRVLRRALALAGGEADRLLALAGDLDERVRDVLLGVARDLLLLVPALHEEDGPRPARVRGLRLGRAHHGVHVLDLELVREVLVLLEPVLAPAHLPASLEVGDLDLLLEAGDDLLRLVGEAVALVLGEVPLLAVADHEVVDGAEDAEHGEDDHERVAAVLHLPAPDASGHVLPAQEEVEQHEGEPAHEPGAEAAGQRLAPALPGDGTHDHDEPERGEQIDELLEGVHRCQALHRWLSTERWARKRPKPMKVR
jgi:hypothetical protein